MRHIHTHTGRREKKDDDHQVTQDIPYPQGELVSGGSVLPAGHTVATGPYRPHQLGASSSKPLRKTEGAQGPLSPLQAAAPSLLPSPPSALTQTNCLSVFPEVSPLNVTAYHYPR